MNVFVRVCEIFLIVFFFFFFFVLTDNVAMVPSAVLKQTLNELSNLRMSTFTSVQSRLKCNLGKFSLKSLSLALCLELCHTSHFSSMVVDYK